MKAVDSARFIFVMLILSLAYLVFEIDFNAQLLDVASNINAEKADLENVENYGRAMSGIGLALLLLGIFYSKKLKDEFNLPKWLKLDSFKVTGDPKPAKPMILFLARLIGFVLALVAWGSTKSGSLQPAGSYLLLIIAVTLITTSFYAPAKSNSIKLLALISGFLLMFFGQKVAIDVYIEYSSVEARTNAYYMYLLKKGLHEDVIEVEGLPFKNDNIDDPVTMTFLSLMGGLVSASPGFLDVVSDKQDEIIQSTVARNSNKHLDSAYDAYQKAGDKVVEQWDWYKTQSKAYSTSGDKASAQQAFVDLLAKRDDMYNGFTKAYTQFTKNASLEAQKMLPDLHDYHKRMSRCSSSSCQNRYYKRFDKRMQSQFGQTVEPFYFCIDVEEDFEARVNNKLADWFGGKKTNQYDCSAHLITKEHVSRKVQGLREADFEKETGYPVSLVGKKADFLIHAETVRQLRDKVRKQGLNVSSGWDHTGQEEFVQAYTSYYKDNAESNWDKQTRRVLGQRVPPMLSYQQFIQHDAVQNKIKSLMGSNYIDGMSMEMSEKQFHETVLKPQLVEEANEEVRRLKYEAEEFANGGSREEEGKAMLRSVIVPPIALFVSLFMTIVTVGKNGIAFIGLLFRMPGLSKLPKSLSKGIKTAVLAGTAGFIFITPFQVSNAFADSKAFKYFMDDYKAVSPVWSYTTEWVMRMEPLVYPAGKQVSAIAEQGLSDVLMAPEKTPWLPEKKIEKDESYTGLTRVIIKPSVPGTNIKIMTIKPKYYDGIPVPPGEHRIVVSKLGYETVDVMVKVPRKGSFTQEITMTTR